MTAQGTNPSTDDQVIMVMTNLPDESAATQVTRAVLAGRLAACVNRLAPCQSEYWWQGHIEHAQEWPLLFKTTQRQYAALEAAIRQHHPYSVPEIVSWPLGGGLPAYLDWVRAEAVGKPKNGHS